MEGLLAFMVDIFKAVAAVVIVSLVAALLFLFYFVEPNQVTKKLEEKALFRIEQDHKEMSRMMAEMMREHQMIEQNSKKIKELEQWIQKQPHPGEAVTAPAATPDDYFVIKNKNVETWKFSSQQNEGIRK